MPTSTNSSPTRVDSWLKANVGKLESAGIGTARLDCLVLLEDVTGKDRAWLLAHPNYEIDTPVIAKLREMIERRSNHEPLAYVRGKTEFYGREFIINQDVLEPRPESETMIDLLKKLDLSAGTIIADIGTGSGALAITAKLELPEAGLIAVDIDRKCLDVARLNAKKLKADVEFLKGDLLKPLKINTDVVLANLPYVPSNYKLNDAAMQEPKLAIFGGEDGLDIYRKMFAQIVNLSHIPKFVLSESLPFQHTELAKIASSAGYNQTTEEDFIQAFTATVPA